MLGSRGVTVLGLLLVAAAAASAGPGDQAPEARWRVAAGPPLGMFEQPPAGTRGETDMPRDQLIEMVQRRFNARVVRVNLMEAGGRRVYEMRLMSAQRVWNVRVDAATGQILEGAN
jgi:uncharacterized membrane protein YkoI